MKFVKLLDHFSIKDTDIIGGKAAHLAELLKNGLPVPRSLVISSNAYEHFIIQSGLLKSLEKLSRVKDTKTALADFRRRLIEAPFPKELLDEIKSAFNELTGNGKPIIARSSSNLEDSPEASFAGLFSSFPNIQSAAELSDAVKLCWNSTFTTEVSAYMKRMGIDLDEIKIAVLLQELRDTKKSGLIFTEDPTRKDKSRIVIETIYGFGEAIVSGRTTPEKVTVLKSDKRVISRHSGFQNFVTSVSGEIKTLHAREKKSERLSDPEISELTDLGLRVEEILGASQDIEWSKDETGFFIVQARPMIYGMEETRHKVELFFKAGETTVLLRGYGVSPQVASGHVEIISDLGKLPRLTPKCIAVIPRLTNDIVTSLQNVAGVITNEGGATSHGANLLREFGIPSVVGTRNATIALKQKQTVTIDGWRGLVYKGQIKPRPVVRHAELYKTRTKVMVTIMVPSAAEELAELADGVSSLRNDYLLLESGTHPTLMVKEERGKELEEIITKGLETVARAFDPKPVWYKTLDAPTDEFRRLRGGEDEPMERNPLLGWRGIARELKDEELLKIEYRAVKNVVEKGYSNIGIKVPFVRKVKEYIQAKMVAEDVGLHPHQNVAFGPSVETPSAALAAEDFISAGVDFFSVGLNDLTMCTLGLDRENEAVAADFNIAHKSVMHLLNDLAKHANKKGVFVTVCGEITSLNLMKKLIKIGFPALGVSPAHFQEVKQKLYRVESEMGIGLEEEVS